MIKNKNDKNNLINKKIIIIKFKKMLTSIFILFYVFLRFVFSKNLNETNFIYKLQNVEDVERFEQCVKILVLNSSKITKEEKKENIVCIFEEARDNPKLIRTFFINLKSIIPSVLKPLLNNSDIEFLYDLIIDICGKNRTFFEDLFDVIEKHPELANYIIILIKEEIDGKNITQEQILEVMHNITNIEGMDIVFNHIINSTYNGAIFTLIETQYINRTNYSRLYGIFKPILIKHKHKIILFMYKILKSYDNINDTLVENIKNFLKNNEDLMRDLKEKFKDEKVRKEFSDVINFLGKIGIIIKEELFRGWKFYEYFFHLIKNEKIAEFIARFIVNAQNLPYLYKKIPEFVKALHEADASFIIYLLNVYTKIIKRIPLDYSTYIEASDKIGDIIYTLKYVYFPNINTIP